MSGQIWVNHVCDCEWPFNNWSELGNWKVLGILTVELRLEAKLCTHIPEYLAEIMSKFGVDPIWNDVTVTS